ncbi:MAG: SUMF1/EgtB/PvdO family nonheme iron enzyme [Culturomica sp.]|nr:SUMF1/EgtB/PvdO family nonheme iron enzyme [Culturomica sp.]
MKRQFLFLGVCCLLLLSLSSCQKVKNLLGFGKEKSTSTGWTYNDPENGNTVAYNKTNKLPKAGPGLIFIPGGTFTMGQREDDVMSDWNNAPRQVTVASFYIDEHEVRNVDWLEYLDWLGRVYISYPEVKQRAVPDSLVWREQLAYNEPMVKNYLHFPSYRSYPVVGVSWEQVDEFCKWRTDRVNEQLLINAGVLVHDPENQKDENSFNTEAYLAGQYTGTLNPKYKGGAVTWDDGILLADYRLPTEAEWEYAAYGTNADLDRERVTEGNLYPWKGPWLRNPEKRYRGRFMANFVRGTADYMGVGGEHANDGYDYTAPVKSFWPNDFGLYDMAGNVNEWVADIYRPLSSQDVASFNPYRGNVFTTPLLDQDGNLAPKDSLGHMRHRLQTDAELALRENYRTADNRNYDDGDLKSRISDGTDWRADDSRSSDDMYLKNANEVTSLIDDEARVYKGGSWKDMAYWLQPGTRRFLNQKKSTNDIGFRCAMSQIGGMNIKKK